MARACSLSLMNVATAANENMSPATVQPVVLMIVATRRSRMQSTHAIASPSSVCLSNRATHHDRTNPAPQEGKRSRISTLAAGRRILCVAVAAVSFAGCASVPGETLAPMSVRRDVSARVLDQAGREKPDCRRLKIVDTEVLEVHADGKVAVERWTVDRCDERVGFRVGYPAKAGAVSVKRDP
jgi:hypothetical protein